MKNKENVEGTENINNQTANSAEEIDTQQDDDDAQLQRLAASIRKILGARRARKQLAPEIPCPDEESAEDSSSDDRPVEWMMRLMH